MTLIRKMRICNGSQATGRFYSNLCILSSLPILARTPSSSSHHLRKNPIILPSSSQESHDPCHHFGYTFENPQWRKVDHQSIIAAKGRFQVGAPKLNGKYLTEYNRLEERQKVFQSVWKDSCQSIKQECTSRRSQNTCLYPNSENSSQISFLDF